MPDFPALGHVAVTVNDLSVSRPWYQKLFGSDPVMDEDTGTFHHVVWMLGNGTIVGIHQFPKLDSSEPFNERRWFDPATNVIQVRSRLSSRPKVDVRIIEAA